MDISKPGKSVVTLPGVGEYLAFFFYGFLDYRLLELDKERKQARICSASKEEVETGNYPEWAFEKRSDTNTNLIDVILKERAKKRGYKIVPEEE